MHSLVIEFFWAEFTKKSIAWNKYVPMLRSPTVEVPFDGFYVLAQPPMQIRAVLSGLFFLTNASRLIFKIDAGKYYAGTHGTWC